MSERTTVTRPLELAIQRAFPRLIVLRLNSGVARSASGRGRIRLAPAGTPDLLVIGLTEWGTTEVLALETKRPKGARRPAQVASERRYVTAGLVWAWVESVEAGVRCVRRVFG